MRNVVLFIAMSLDGFIAAKDGGVDWLAGESASASDSGSYERFIAGVSDVVMGYTTYHQLTTELMPGAWPYAAQKSHVLTHKEEAPLEAGVTLTSETAAELVARLKQEPGGDIWICGGANVANQFIRAGLVDRFHISVIPTLRGAGIRLFDTLPEPVLLKLISTESYNGIVDLVYGVR